LYARSTGLYTILKKINPNACVIYLPLDFGISSTFNISNLVAYQGSFNLDNSLMDLDESTLSLPLMDTYYTCLIYIKTN